MLATLSHDEDEIGKQVGLSKRQVADIALGRVRPEQVVESAPPFTVGFASTTKSSSRSFIAASRRTRGRPFPVDLGPHVARPPANQAAVWPFPLDGPSLNVLRPRSATPTSNWSFEPPDRTKEESHGRTSTKCRPESFRPSCRLMEEKEKAHEDLPSEVGSAIVNGLLAWGEAALGRRPSKAGSTSPRASTAGR